MKTWTRGLLLGVVWSGVTAWVSAAGSASETALERAYALDVGEDGARDAEQAAILYAEAAVAGSAEAHLRLGYLYEVGDGVPQDYGEARVHYEQAVALGLPEARMRLAMCHLEGWGGPVDRAAFARELRAAAEAGYAPAVRAMAGACFIGVGQERDEAAGRAWLMTLAEGDDLDAQTEIGRSLERQARRNLTGEADQKLSRTWFQLSAEQDFALAMRSMAQSLMREQRDEEHWAAAKAWLELAAEGGDAESPFVLGVLCSRPVGLTAGEEGEALRWMELAAERSNRRAVEVLDQMEAGMPLPDAVRYVLSTPYNDRYAQSYGKKQRAAGDPNNHGPLPVRLVKPVFPQPLRMSQTEGQAMVDFVVDTTGRVERATSVEATHPLFGERAVSAVKLWRFEPAVKDGRRVKARMRVPVMFQFSEADRLDGLDGLLSGARHTAVSRGWVAEEPPVEFHLARPMFGLPRLPLADGQIPPADWRVLLVIRLSEVGQPQEVHVVEAQPEWMGDIASRAAEEHGFMPVFEDGKPVEAWIVFPMIQRASKAATTEATIP